MIRDQPVAKLNITTIPVIKSTDAINNASSDDDLAQSSKAMLNDSNKRKQKMTLQAKTMD